MLEHKELINALIPEDKAKRKELIHALSFLDVLRMFVNHRPVGDILQKEVRSEGGRWNALFRRRQVPRRGGLL